MLSSYVRAVMPTADYEILDEDGSYYGEIPGFDGDYANATTIEACRQELEEVLEECLLFRIARNLPLSEIDGISLTIKQVT